MKRLPIGEILQGHALSVLPTLPAESVNCVVTSPPYWKKRDYHGAGVEWPGTHAAGMQKCDYGGGWVGNLGQEPHPLLYIAHLCDIFDEVKRILRDDGVLWVVIGDTMSGSGGDHKLHHQSKAEYQKYHEYTVRTGGRGNKADFPKKCQCCIPERFSLEMINRGWIRHSTCIWHKTNPKPESVNTRFTNDFEYVYMFVKSQKIYFDTQFEPSVSGNWRARGGSLLNDTGWARDAGTNEYNRGKPDRRLGKGRIEYDGKCKGKKGEGGRAFVKVEKFRRMRTTFNLALQPFIGAHFAVFPDKLIEPLIKATCPLAVCSKCGRPRREIYKQTHVKTRPYKKSKFPGSGQSGEGEIGLRERWEVDSREFVGYDFCSCGAGLRKGVVFDPFMGAGTTALVAEKLNRDWCGVELNKNYIRMAYRRLAKWTK